MNDSRRHRGVMRSSRMRLPMGGALGRMSWAGTAARVLKQAPRADRVTVPTAARQAVTEVTGSMP